MSKSIASSLPQVASVLLVSAVIAACGSQKPGSSFDTGSSGKSGSSSGSSGGDDDGVTYDGGGNSSGGLNRADAGQPPGDLSDAGCATATAAATRQPVYMLFVLDGSGSMDSDNKWVAATAAIDAIFTDMSTKADPGVGAGLIVFSDSKDQSLGSGPYPTKSDVPIAFVNAAQLTKLTNRTSGSPSFGTPTGTAIGVPSGGAYAEIKAFNPSAPLPPGGKKVVVLITDGVPTDACSTNGDGSDNYPQNACVVGAGQQWSAGTGIETFVIGVGTLPGDFGNFDPYFLGALAQAGGSAPAGCDPKANSTGANFCYFEVDPSGSASATQKAFETAIDNIRGQVASCTIPLQLNADAGTVDPSKVNVQINGQTINQDPQNGWSYDNPNNPTQIILNGQACTDMKNTANASISIVLGCATQVPPPAK